MRTRPARGEQQAQTQTQTQGCINTREHLLVFTLARLPRPAGHSQFISGYTLTIRNTPKTRSAIPK